MDANTKAIFDRMTVDGGRITWQHIGNDVLFQRKAMIHDALVASGLSLEAVARQMKMDVVVSGGKARKYLDVCWLNGSALSVVLSIQPHLWRNVTELHSKVYLTERFDGAHNTFIDALWSSRFPATVAAFRGKPNARSRKSDGQKGMRIGNAKSDSHVISYKARNEKSGMEVHQKGRAIQRVKAQVDRFFFDPSVKSDDFLLCGAFKLEAHAQAARKISKSLRDAGINIAEFFEATSNVSWRTALFTEEPVYFDEELEADMVRIATSKRAQASFLGTEADADALEA